MIRRSLQAVVLAGLVALALAGCAFAPLSILGTWVYTDGSESIEFTLGKFILTATSGGTWECKIDKVESSNDRLQMTTTQATGTLSAMSYEGQKWYLLWDVAGDTMFVGISTTAYPTTTTFGPYYKD